MAARKTGKSTRKKATRKKAGARKLVETLTHEEASRKNIPTAEYQSVLDPEDQSPLQIAYQRRNRDLDPQLVWRGKDEQDWSDLLVQAPPLFIQEKVHPKVLIDDLLRRSERTEAQKAATEPGFQADLFADFNGLPDEGARTEFYQHDANWSNRMILGDSLQVMASLAEREGLRGKVQVVYLDPPYGIRFNSNFQWSTTTRDVTDGKTDHITREPEQVKAFRDTWRDGIHSYLTYLRDRVTCIRDLLDPSGSLFVQIGDENLHRVRSLLDEVLGEANFVSLITIQKAGSTFSQYLGGVADYVLWYAKDRNKLKYRDLYAKRDISDEDFGRFTIAQVAVGKRVALKALGRVPTAEELVAPDPLQSASVGREKGEGAASWFPVDLEGREFRPTLQSRWKTNEIGMSRLIKSDRVIVQKNSIRYARRFSDFPVSVLTNIWADLAGAVDKVYVVQTSTRVVERCVLLASDPGDLVLDPTCGSGTTAYVAEQWGRRWITIDTSRVALALARARIMGARYRYYLLADSREGQAKVAELSRTEASHSPVGGDIRHGFVYERVPHIQLKSIVNNEEIDVVWEDHEKKLESLRSELNAILQQSWAEWEIPWEAGQEWPAQAKKLHTEWSKAREERQNQIDGSINAKADFEYLYDKPYEETRKVRVAGPFTVETISPHRVLGVDENDELIDRVADARLGYGETQDFAGMVLENLRTAGVQQAHKEDKIVFSALAPWPGKWICADGRYFESDESEKRAAIFVGPEFGTVSRPDLVSAAREAAEGDFDVLIACAFNYEAHASDFDKLGRVPVLKARMNADLHMAEDLKNTGKGNLFVIFGEPDIEIQPASVDGKDQIQVRIRGVDVFHPSTGEVRSDGAEGIACWFIDTDYNEESFFVRHAYFLGANDPYKALKTTLKAEIHEEAWETLHSDTSRPFDRPASGRIAVKVINHLGDEVMEGLSRELMEFRIADTFTESLAKLTGEEQKAVKTTAFDLQMNPANPGMQFHKLDRAKDKNFWSVRVSRDIRLIVHKTASSLLLCYVDHHDPAYRWAERRRLETHPKTGAAQLVEVRETVREIEIPRYVEAEVAASTAPSPAPPTPKPVLFSDVPEEDLLAYGVPPEWLADVRQATEDTLLGLADHLPGEAAEALLELAVGSTPVLPVQATQDADPFTHPDAQRRFRVMANAEELERALEFPWDKWTVFLHPAQREIVERDYAGPARVCGSAGTGKTIVALHRAVHLARIHPESRVLLATFSEPLANGLRVRLRRLLGREPRLGERLEVHSMSSIGQRLYEANFGTPELASDARVKELLEIAAGEAPEQRFSSHFLWTEWATVVDAWQLESWEEYRDVRRLGRKTRLPEKQRAVLWSIFEKVRAALETEGLLTESALFRRLEGKLAKAKHPAFDFAVIDEAQDIGVPELRLLAALGGERTNGLFFAGDLGQRIFQAPFSWRSLGVEVRGRSQTLRINYRTSHQIRNHADRLLPPALADVDGNREERRGTVSVFNGPEPSISVLESKESEASAIREWLEARIDEGFAPHELGVFVRSDAELERASAPVQAAGLTAAHLDDHSGGVSGKVAIGAMHLAKGLEFRGVVVAACDDEIVPLQSRIENVGDDADLEDVYSTERHLLYVACTRARDQLLVTGVEPASEFLDDLQMSGNGARVTS